MASGAKCLKGAIQFKIVACYDCHLDSSIVKFLCQAANIIAENPITKNRVFYLKKTELLSPSIVGN